jgi:hypothetical protein
VHQPSLSFEGRSGVGVERLVAVKENVTFLVEKLERFQRDAGKNGLACQRRIADDALRPQPVVKTIAPKARNKRSDLNAMVAPIKISAVYCFVSAETIAVFWADW